MISIEILKKTLELIKKQEELSNVQEELPKQKINIEEKKVSNTNTIKKSKTKYGSNSNKERIIERLNLINNFSPKVENITVCDTSNDTADNTAATVHGYYIFIPSFSPINLYYNTKIQLFIKIQ